MRLLIVPTNIISLIFSLLTLTACTSVGDLKSISDVIKPTVKVANTQIEKFSMDDVDLTVNLDVDNPNPVPINLAGFDYELLINNKQFTQGTQNKSSSIAAAGVSKLAVPINIKFSELFKIFKDFDALNEMNYEIKTVTRLDLPFVGVYPVSAATKGKLPIPKVPSISVKSITLDKMNFTSVDLLVKMNIKNPNIFGIDISKLAYKLSVSGDEWVKSRLTESLNLAQESENEVVLPLKLNILKVSGALLSALQSNEALSYRINGDLKFDTSLPLLKQISMPFDYSAKTTTL